MLYQLNDRIPELLGDNFVADNAAVIGSVRMMRVPYTSNANKVHFG